MGAWLDRARWTFVLARVQALEWRELDFKVQDLGRTGGAAFGDCLAQLTSLRRLDLQKSGIGADVVAVVASCLTELTRLRDLDLRFNSLGGEGWRAMLDGIQRCDA